jgi:DNA-directed RNA polymerase specialized sigma24 family protein
MRTLFARHQMRVYRFVLRLVRNGATAEDVLSDVFLDVWRQASLAAIVGISEATVKMRMFYSRKNLVELVQDRRACTSCRLAHSLLQNLMIERYGRSWVHRYAEYAF